MNVTPELLSELERLDREATTGPWTVGDENDAGADIEIGETCTDFSTCRFSRYDETPSYSREEMLNNVHLVYELRNALPSILADLRELVAVKRWARGRCTCCANRSIPRGKVCELCDRKRAVNLRDNWRGAWDPKEAE